MNSIKYLLKYILFLPPLFCLFWNLDHVAFWDDEAQTVILAKNFNLTGSLTGWDGKNLYAYRNGSLLRNDYSIIQPPLDILVTALSIRMFGVSETAARIPFAFLALGALLIFHSILRTTAIQPTQRFLSTLVLAYSTQFILNGRQCRYYALCLFLGLLLHRFYLFFNLRRSFPLGVAISACAVLLYLANYMLAAAWIATLFASDWLWNRASARQRLINLAPFILVAVIPIALHAVNLRIWDRQDIFYDTPWYVRRLYHLWRYPRDLLYFCPTVLVVLAAALNRTERQHWLWEVMTLFYGNAIAIAFLTPQPSGATYSDFRFLILSLPWGAAILGDLAWRVVSYNRTLGTVGIGLALSTNLFLLGYTRNRPTWTFPALALSLSRHYPTGIEAAKNYLNTHLQIGQTLSTSPEHFSYPLGHYVEKAQLCCQLNDSTQLNQARSLTAPLFSRSPDWMVLFERTPQTVSDLGRMQGEYRLVQTLDVYFDQTQRPEPFEHSFFPITKFGSLQKVFIYRRILSRQ